MGAEFLNQQQLRDSGNPVVAEGIDRPSDCNKSTQDTVNGCIARGSLVFLGALQVPVDAERTKLRAHQTEVVQGSDNGVQPQSHNRSGVNADNVISVFDKALRGLGVVDIDKFKQNFPTNSMHLAANALNADAVAYNGVFLAAAARHSDENSLCSINKNGQQQIEVTVESWGYAVLRCKRNNNGTWDDSEPDNTPSLLSGKVSRRFIWDSQKQDFDKIGIYASNSVLSAMLMGESKALVAKVEEDKQFDALCARAANEEWAQAESELKKWIDNAQSGTDEVKQAVVDFRQVIKEERSLWSRKTGNYSEYAKQVNALTEDVRAVLNAVQYSKIPKHKEALEKRMEMRKQELTTGRRLCDRRWQLAKGNTCQKVLYTMLAVGNALCWSVGGKPKAYQVDQTYSSALTGVSTFFQEKSSVLGSHNAETAPLLQKS